MAALDLSNPKSWWPWGIVVAVLFSLTTPSATADKQAALPKMPSSAAAFQRAFETFKHRFITPEGRIVDDYNGAISHSEGQGYGLLAAALAGDKATFDRVWSWTSANLLIRDDHLAAWRWDPKTSPHVTDLNNATDGDLLMTWALLEASTKWTGNYKKEARRLADAIAGHLVFPGRYGPMLRPGVWHFGAGDQSDGPIVNLSYWIFPALRRLAEDDPAGPWSQLVSSGIALVEASRFGPMALPSDWISVARSATPASMKQPRFGYDAIRIPLYLKWAFPDRRKLTTSFLGIVQNEVPHVVDLASGTRLEPFGGEGFKLLALCIEGAVKPGEAERIDMQHDVYYPFVLGMFSLYAMASRGETTAHDK